MTPKELLVEMIACNEIEIIEDEAFREQSY